ncbi:MAG: hypothetical protein K0Q74_1266 [Gammaproteobacteria bacterium]|nr:hypothetical protein [Gammaproteobacteria bacterium]
MKKPIGIYLGFYLLPILIQGTTQRRLWPDGLPAILLVLNS